MKIILISFMLIHLASAKYCRRTREICFQVGKCHQEECPAEYSNVCDNDVCADHKTLCQILTQFQLSTDAIPSPYLKSVKMSRLKKFKTNMKACSYAKYEKLKPTDVCLNRKDCYQIASYPNRNEIWYKPAACECPGRHSYNCNDAYCAVNDIACNQFISSDMNKLASIEKCENS